MAALFLFPMALALRNSRSRQCSRCMGHGCCACSYNSLRSSTFCAGQGCIYGCHHWGSGERVRRGSLEVTVTNLSELEGPRSLFSLHKRATVHDPVVVLKVADAIQKTESLSPNAPGRSYHSGEEISINQELRLPVYSRRVERVQMQVFLYGRKHGRRKRHDSRLLGSAKVSLSRVVSRGFDHVSVSLIDLRGRVCGRISLLLAYDAAAAAAVAGAQPGGASNTQGQAGDVAAAQGATAGAGGVAAAAPAGEFCGVRASHSADVQREAPIVVYSAGCQAAIAIREDS